MQVKTTMRYHLTHVRTAIIKRTQITDVNEDMEKRELSYTVGGNVNWYSHYGKQWGGGFLKKLKIKLQNDPVIPLLGIHF